CLQAVPGFAATRNSQPHLSTQYLIDNLPVFSDFDGDTELDQATLSSSGGLKSIHIVFGKSSWSSLSFDSNEADRGGLLSGDIDSDGDMDLVWISQSAGKFVAWLGDGRGHFSIAGNMKLSFDGIRALLGDGAPRLADAVDVAELAAVLLNTIFIVPETQDCHA